MRLFINKNFGYAPDIGELADLMQAAQALAAAAGVPMPKATARHALALVTAQLRAARGLPAKQPRQTRHENGQTQFIEASLPTGKPTPKTGKPSTVTPDLRR